MSYNYDHLFTANLYLSRLEDGTPMEASVVAKGLECLALSRVSMIRIRVQIRTRLAEILLKYGKGILSAGLGASHRCITEVARTFQSTGSLEAVKDQEVLAALAWLYEYDVCFFAMECQLQDLPKLLDYMERNPEEAPQ